MSFPLLYGYKTELFHLCPVFGMLNYHCSSMGYSPEWTHGTRFSVAFFPPRYLYDVCFPTHLTSNTFNASVSQNSVFFFSFVGWKSFGVYSSIILTSTHYTGSWSALCLL